jgi:hypothetical protein
MRAVHILPLVVLAGCDGGVGSGKLVFGIVSGGEQTVPVATEQLDPVLGKMVRTPDGGVTLHLVTPLYAQTVVQGAPVAGALACPKQVPGGPIPWTPCSVTASDGTVAIWFGAGTVAALHPVEIRGEVDGEPAVFDTAYITQSPGPLAAWGVGPSTGSGWVGEVREGDTLRVDTLDVRGRDEWYNAIPRASVVANAQSVRSIWVAYPNTYPSEPPADAVVGWTVVIPGGASDWGSKAGAIDAHLVMWIDGVTGSGYFHVSP